MFFRFAGIHCIYGIHKYLAITVEFSCLCGHTKQHSITCYRYGRITAECTQCTRRQTLELNRKYILMFFSIHAPLLINDTTLFLDLWEQEMP